MTDDVQVKFGGDTSDLNDAADRAKGKINEVGDGAEKTGSIFDDLGKKIAAAFTVAEMVEFTNRFAELSEQIERTSQILGQTTNEVQEFSFAVKMTGGDTEGATTMMERLERNMVQAANQAGPARAAFAQLGITVSDLKNLSFDEVLDKIAQKYSETADGAVKVNNAIAVGGRGFANMIPTLDQGTDGLEKLRQKFVDTGAEIDPKTTEQMAHLNQSLITLGTAFRGLGQEIVEYFIGPIQDATDWMTKFIERVNASHFNPKTGQLEVSGGGGAGGGGVGGYSPAPGSTVNDIFGSPSYSVGGAGGGDSGGKPELPTAQNQQAADQQIKIAEDTLRTQLELNKIKLDSDKDTLDQEVELGQITESQKVAQLVDYENQTYESDQRALQSALQTDNLTLEEKKKLLDQLQVLEAQHNANIQKLNAQAITAQTKQYQQYFDVIDKSFDSMVTGILQGTQTWHQTMLRFFSDILTGFIGMAEKMVTKWVESELIQTSTTQTGVAARTAAKTAGESEGLAAHFEALIKQITGDAAATYSGVFAFLSPVMGPLAAVPAGAAAALVAGMEALVPSFDVGAWNIPSSGLAMVHAGETILPAGQAQSFREAVGNGGGVGGGSTQISIACLDRRGLKQLLMENADLVAAAGNRASRNFNQNAAQGWK